MKLLRIAPIAILACALALSACANTVRGVDNVVLAGCGTTPGVGIPPVLISGRLAAQRVTGGAAGTRGRTPRP